MNDQEILHSKFDIQTHAENFINYLEVIIRRDGIIEYAVPSHQEKLKAICISETNKEEFISRLNEPEAWADYLQWLCDYSGCISVWNTFCVKPYGCTSAQLESLKRLGETFYTKMPHLKLYQGEI
jgi:hypothetical protein